MENVSKPELSHRRGERNMKDGKLKQGVYGRTGLFPSVAISLLWRIHICIYNSHWSWEIFCYICTWWKLETLETLLSTRLFFNTKFLLAMHMHKNAHIQFYYHQLRQSWAGCYSTRCKQWYMVQVGKIMFLTCLLDESLSETLISTR